ncbi:MAG: SEC-C domain-containing protein [Acidobacteriota bacterium]
MTAPAQTPSPASTPLETLAAKLRPELNPTTQLEAMFFDQIVRLTLLAAFLMRHIQADPEFANTETTRRMRLLLSNEGRLRYAYEEFRRLQLARQLQREDPEEAGLPILTIVARHTTRNGYRAIRRTAAAPSAPNTATPSRAVAANAARVAPTGRNAQCPCNSGRKFKHCCLNKQAVAA